MLPVQYKLFIDGQSAKKADLDRIDTITVHQQMDQIWEASIAFLIRASDKGQWDDDSKLAKPLKRLRVEIKVGDGSFVPLIDGPLVGADPQLHSEPGRSQRILRVFDDSIFLTRDGEREEITGDDDSKLAKKIFEKAKDVIKDTGLGNTAAPPSDRTTSIRPTGTLLDALHTLAARHPKMHAWVKPGKDPGQSKGMFQLEDDKTSGLPALVLFGKERNIDSFSVSQDVQRPARVTGAQLSISDLSVKKAKASYGDVLDGGDAAVEDAKVATVPLPPGFDIGVDLDDAVKALCANYAVVYEAQGQVRNFCYAGVLEPYRRVTVKAVGEKISGDWLIRSVTHTITRSDYSQAFALERRDETKKGGAKTPDSSAR